MVAGAVETCISAIDSSCSSITYEIMVPVKFRGKRQGARGKRGERGKRGKRGKRVKRGKRGKRGKRSKRQWARGEEG
jgi:hypothetical protein